MCVSKSFEQILEKKNKRKNKYLNFTYSSLMLGTFGKKIDLFIYSST